jgi:hypothetical protein
MPNEASTANGLHPQGSGTSAAALQEPLVTVPLSKNHRVADFICSNSQRVAGFFGKEAKLLVPNYCRVFVAPNPEDDTEVWGYYTLSAAILLKTQLTGTDEKRAVRNYFGYPAPMVRIGFMGRHDAAQKGFGVGLLIDAARRVHRNTDIAAWGLVLEPERGRDNKKLWDWYEGQGFKPCRGTEPQSVYAPLSAFLPELQT